MIGFLRGTLLEKHPPWLLVDVNGIGYEVQAPMTTIYLLPAPGQALSLFTHLLVREDAHQLYGFSDARTRELFRSLIKVNGIGPKMALALLSAMDADALTQCILDNRPAVLVKVPGIGQKTAERLLVELRDRLKPVMHIGHNGDPAPDSPTTQTDTESIRIDAEAALQALGYKPQEAERAIAAVIRESGMQGTEDLIRLALKRMVTR